MKVQRTAIAPPKLEEQISMTRRAIRQFGTSKDHRAAGAATVAFLRDQAVGISPVQRAALDARTGA